MTDFSFKLMLYLLFGIAGLIITVVAICLVCSVPQTTSFEFNAQIVDADSGVLGNTVTLANGTKYVVQNNWNYQFHVADIVINGTYYIQGYIEHSIFTNENVVSVTQLNLISSVGVH
jgi:hypothetical protein